jgi:hypothetical protein
VRVARGSARARLLFLASSDYVPQGTSLIHLSLFSNGPLVGSFHTAIQCSRTYKSLRIALMYGSTPLNPFQLSVWFALVWRLSFLSQPPHIFDSIKPPDIVWLPRRPITFDHRLCLDIPTTKLTNSPSPLC